MNKQWYRRYPTIVQSARVRGMSPRAQLDYGYLLDLAALNRATLSDVSGATGHTIRSAGSILDSRHFASKTWPEIVAAGLASLTENGTIVLADWNIKQFASDFSANRMQKKRERENKELGRNVTAK